MIHCKVSQIIHDIRVKRLDVFRIFKQENVFLKKLFVLILIPLETSEKFEFSIQDIFSKDKFLAMELTYLISNNCWIIHILNALSSEVIGPLSNYFWADEKKIKSAFLWFSNSA